MKFSLSFLTALFVIFLSSCSDPCDDVLCGDNGVCDDGTCICDAGYEGLSCETKIIDKYLGTWTSNDFQCDGIDFSPVTFVIEQGATVTDIQWYDSDAPEDVLLINYDGNTLTVPSQPVDDITLSGTGTLNSDNTISFNFEIIDGADTEFCSGIFSK